MKVLVSDKMSQDGIDVLNAVDEIQVVYKTGMSTEELIKELQDVDALVIRSSTKVTKEVFEAVNKLKIIGRAGIGVDNVDCNVATERGVIVVNTPSGNATTTAEHAIAMLMSLSRHIPQADKSMHAGLWEKSKFTGTEITGKVLGVVGYGNIGKIVADRALGLKMRVIVFDPFLTSEVAAKDGVELVTKEKLFERSDYITVHVPLNDSTRDLINKKSIETMKTGVRILNCARGGIVNESDLIDGLNSGKIAGAAVDVFKEEPPPKDNPLLQHEGVVCTPHLGASTAEAQVNVAVQVAEQIRDYLLTGEIRNGINCPSISSEMVKVLSPYLKLCDKLGSFQGQIHRETHEEIKKLTISYSGSVTDYDTGALTSALVHGFLNTVSDGSVNFVNALSIAESRGIVVEENLVHHVQDFANQITFSVSGEKQTNLIAGTVFGKKNYRFVHFNDFFLEVIPDGYLLVLHNYDRPGVIGKATSILGSHEINVSRMQLTLDKTFQPGSNESCLQEAVSFINIDQPVNEMILEELMKLDNVIAVHQIDLN
ncbi:D-3-phosphoglycerate dehydrogenase [Candidatus Scalindua japonica]|uniref:D-3-phosphoglycerate dehydrogenase n=1 Tax=Candidatus Scalindua japonica TaxID=1284222 RepID=A0A286TUT1_9BACT|nr:phosphoglycerate dehydrogenase [Candidatus Scalindua japonica]GAX59623.1 D-3-phosphoglycerate dehydrogenase [Candidatus Scalindua japonica]